MKAMHADGRTASQLALRYLAFRVVAFATVLTFVLGAALRNDIGEASAVEDYPTWSDVAEARSSEAATQKLVSRLESALVRLAAEAAAAQKDAEDKGNIWQEADNEYQAKAAQTAALQEQADAASSEADQAETRIAELAARLVRAGGRDMTVNLLINSQIADSLLCGLEPQCRCDQLERLGETFRRLHHFCLWFQLTVWGEVPQTSRPRCKLRN